MHSRSSGEGGVISVLGKAAQPYNATSPDPLNIGAKNQLLAILSALQNADKHRELVVVGGYVEIHEVVGRQDDGTVGVLNIEPHPWRAHHVVNDGPELDLARIANLDPASVEVEVKGVVKALIGRGHDRGPMYEPETLTRLIGFARQRITELVALL